MLAALDHTYKTALQQMLQPQLIQQLQQRQQLQ